MPENTEAERLRRELDAVREAHELEMHKLRMSLQERTERIDYLKSDRERMRQERGFVKEGLEAEIKQLKLTHAREIEELKTMLAGATYDRAFALSESRKAWDSLDDLRRRLEGNDVELRNLRNALQREGESLKGATGENRALKEEIVELKASHRRAVDESTTLLQSLKGETEAKAATQRFLQQEKDEKGRALLQNERLTGELEDLRRQLETNNAELVNLRGALQHERELSRGAAEKNGRLKEEVVHLNESAGQEQQDKVVTQRSLRRDWDEKDRILPQNERLTGELDNTKRQLEGNVIELQHSQRRGYDGGSPKEAGENQKPIERLHRFKESDQNSVDDSSTPLSSHQRLMEELDIVRRQQGSRGAEFKDLQNEPQRLQRLGDEGESLRGAAAENRLLKEQLTRLRASHRKTSDEFTALSQSYQREQEDKVAIQQALRREKDGKGRALSRNEQLTGERDDLVRQLESKDVELTSLRDALQHKDESYKKRAEENWKLREEIVQLEASYWAAIDESTALSQSLRREQEGKVAMQVMGELGGPRHQPEGKDAEANNLRSGLEQSHTKHDELTTAEVIALVDALNVEILQTSAFISDSFDYARKPAHANKTKATSARISEFIGSILASLVRTVSHSDNDLLVQIALQSATVELSRQIILTWDLGDLQAKQPLAKLYSNIRETETQAVGGRWRALTRAHAQKVALWEGNPHATMVARISNALAAILVAAGCTKSFEDTRRTFADKFGEHISGIVKMALRLNKAMGEEVTSADLRPVSVVSGEKFDAATMANFESHEEDLKGQFVLCTTALGMERSEKVQGDVVELKTTILLKPKVAVESVVDALDGVTR